jgi:hypothetical protein
MEQICSLKKKTDRLHYFANTFEPAHTQRKPMKLRATQYGFFDKNMLLMEGSIRSTVSYVKEV